MICEVFMSYVNTGSAITSAFRKRIMLVYITTAGVSSSSATTAATPRGRNRIDDNNVEAKQISTVCEVDKLNEFSRRKENKLRRVHLRRH